MPCEFKVSTIVAALSTSGGATTEPHAVLEPTTTKFRIFRKVSWHDRTARSRRFATMRLGKCNLFVVLIALFHTVAYIEGSLLCSRMENFDAKLAGAISHESRSGERLNQIYTLRNRRCHLRLCPLTDLTSRLLLDHFALLYYNLSRRQAYD